MSDQKKPANKANPQGVKKKGGPVKQPPGGFPTLVPVRPGKLPVKRDLSSFGGYPCPHYRERPVAPSLSSTCLGCINVPYCASHEDRSGTYGSGSTQPTTRLAPHELGRGAGAGGPVPPGDDTIRAHVSPEGSTTNPTGEDQHQQAARTNGGLIEDNPFSTEGHGPNTPTTTTAGTNTTDTIDTSGGNSNTIARLRSEGNNPREGREGEGTSTPTPASTATSHSRGEEEDQTSRGEENRIVASPRERTPNSRGEENRIGDMPPAGTPSTRGEVPLQDAASGDGGSGEGMAGAGRGGEGASSPSLSSSPSSSPSPLSASLSATLAPLRDGAVVAASPNARSLPVVGADGQLNLGAYRSSMPRVECNTCMLYDECPKAKPHAVCAYNELFDSFDTRSPAGIAAALDALVEEDGRRTMMAILQERLTTGGQIDPRVSHQMDSYQRRLVQVLGVKAALNPSSRKGPTHGVPGQATFVAYQGPAEGLNMGHGNGVSGTPYVGGSSGGLISKLLAMAVPTPSLDPTTGNPTQDPPAAASSTGTIDTTGLEIEDPNAPGLEAMSTHTTKHRAHITPPEDE